MARRSRPTRLAAPYLRALRLREDAAPLPDRYPFDLPWLDAGFSFEFNEPVTIFVGENGSGKSTLVEAVAALAGFPLSGGGAWVGSPDAAAADEDNPGALAARLRASWLPKVARGWFLRAGSFEAVAGMLATDHLSVSHGEGFLQLMSARMQEQGVYILDEPEAALSPRRELELLRFLGDVQEKSDAQVVMATHSPILMAVPGAALWRLTHRGLSRISYRDTDHFRLCQAFTADPERFVAQAMAGRLDELV